MSDKELFPVHTDEDGIDRPFIGSQHATMLVVERLLREHVPIRTEPPAALDQRQLAHHAVGSVPLVVMGLAAALWLVPGLPDPARAFGAAGYLLAPIVAAAVVGRRRIAKLPPDLRPHARAALRRHYTGVRPIRWRWIVTRLVLAVVVVVSAVVVVATLLGE